tara:strand:- start:1613 stop:2851 length:1239 start_codon:yes stop_codon:yes gene_type:complete
VKVFVFASCQKTFNYLRNVHDALKSSGHQSFFFHTLNNDTTGPPYGYDAWVHDGYVPEEGAPVSESLGIHLPFIPDYLIVARDRWNPELTVIQEFKAKWNTKVGLVEINTNLYTAIEIQMEMLSRKKQGNEFIDINFDHSEHSLNMKKKHIEWDGWDKSVIVGNPYWDKFEESKLRDVAVEAYKVDKNKTQILIFSECNVTRPEFLQNIQYFARNLNRDKYQLYFKPYPAEPWHHLFQHQYKKNEDGSIDFFLKDLFDGIIYQQIDLIPMMNLCEYHIANISSVNYGSVLMGKQLVSMDNVTNFLNKCTDLDIFKSNLEGVGESWKSNFWMRVHELKDEKEFENMVTDNLEDYKNINNKFKKDLFEYAHHFDVFGNFLNKNKKESKSLLKYYDDFGDGNSAKRIVENLEKIA